MFTDRLLEGLTNSAPEGPEEGPAEEQIEQILDECNEQFKEAIEAVTKVEEPHLLCILSHGGMGAWENCTDGPATLEDLRTIAELVVAIVAEHIAYEYDDDELAAWLARLVAANL